MQSTFDKNTNGNIDIYIELSWAEIADAYNIEVDEAVKNSEYSGFRKGKAPRDLVVSKLDKDKTYSQTIQHILPKIYGESIKQHGLKPIVHPHLTLVEGEEGKAWKFKATICETPQVALAPNYLQKISQIPKEPKEDKLSRIIEQLRSDSNVQIADVLVEEESNHRLSSLAENITSLGLNTESYLQSKKITAEDLKSQISTQSRHDLEVEFLLNKIREEHKLENRQKTLDFLQSQV